MTPSKLQSTKHALCFILIVRILTFACTGAEDFWQKANGPYGGYISALAVNSNGLIFAATLRGGVFRSDDNGINWKNAGLKNVFVHQLTINSKDHILAVTDYPSGIFRSTDNGENWTRIDTSLRFTEVATLTLNSNGHFFAGCLTNGVFRSTDDGKSWLPINTGLTDSDVLTLAVNSRGFLFAGLGRSGIFRAISDDDVTWTRVGFMNIRVSCFATNLRGDIFAGGHGGVFRSTDDGVSWIKLDSGLTSDYISSFFINRSGHLYAGTNGGVFRSVDNGASWSNMGLKGAVECIAINSNGYMFAGTQKGFLRCTDGGSNWAEANGNIAATRIRCLTVNQGGQIFAGTNGTGIFRSTNAGASWTPINVGLVGKDVYAIVATSFGHLYAGISRDGVCRSTDDGNTWIKTTLADLSVFSFSVDSNGVLFAGSFGGFYSSMDNGLHWTAIRTDTSYRLLSDVRDIVRNSVGDIYAGTYMNGVFRSMDNGTSWSNIGLTNNPGILSLVINREGDVFAGTLAGMFRYSGKDTIWTSVGLKGAFVWSLVINSDGHIFAGTYQGGVLRSTDEGNNWHEINTGLTNHIVQTLALDSNGYLYAGTEGGGVFRSSRPQK